MTLTLPYITNIGIFQFGVMPTYNVEDKIFLTFLSKYENCKNFEKVCTVNL